METIVRQKIKELLHKYDSNILQLAGGDQRTYMRFRRQLKDNLPLSCELIFAVLKTYPEVSAEWLLRNEGEMVRSEKTNLQVINLNKGDANVVSGNDATISKTEKSGDNETIKELLEQNRRLIEFITTR